jgi:hypothetical protein
MSLSPHVALIEHRFGAEAAAAWRKYHVAAQLARLVSGVVGSVLWTAQHGGVHDWTGLVFVAGGAFWATLAQIWPGVPWLLWRGWLHRTPPPGPTAGGVGG